MGAMNEDVRYWFERAVRLSPDARRAMLESSCADQGVRAEVMSLLEFDSGGPDSESDLPVSKAIKEIAGSAFDSPSREFPAQRVGPFELGRMLGSGGMGSVYEAHRVDGQVRQRVAVKFVQVSPLSSERFRDSVRRRFARERQMLASLRHPYIAGLIDAGTTEGGTPYAVIEQVDGVPIDEYCDKLLPDPADRIRLVLKLCEAVQFAHRNLIVHSDIKPENVLVTEDGTPKLIDFGVASDLADDTTLTTMRAFTPGYASPEQCRGMAATVATDVFGLGGVLYRVLTGARPREIEGGSLEEVIRVICEEDVIRPSAIKPELRGDAENILLKALQREPQRRYGSAPELADDLNRMLARRPVRATPDSVWYRASRFTRRHWVPLLTTAAFIAALAVFAAVSQQQRASALRRAAESRRLAERLLFEVHDEIGGVLGGTKARERLGVIAVQFLESLERDYGGDPELAWEMLNAYSRLGQSRGGVVSSVGDTASALQLARKALSMGDIVERTAPGPERLDELFTAYQGLTAIFEDARRPTEQREILDRMLRIAARLQPLRQAQAQAALARFHDNRGARKEAAEAFGQALSILRPLAKDPAKPPGAEEQLTSVLVGYGRSQALAGDFESSVVTLQEAIRSSERRIAAEPNRSRSVRQLYWGNIALGDVYGSPGRFNLGRVSEAVQHYQKARGIAEKMVAADPDNEAATLDLARAYMREGVALAAARPAEALTLLERSRALAAGTSSGNHVGLESRFDYLTASIAPLIESGGLEQARTHLSRAHQLLEEMNKAGMKRDDRDLRKAESMWLYAAGRKQEALAQVLQYVATIPEETSPVLSLDYDKVETLERIRRYASGIDPQACRSAAARLLLTWEELRSIHPQSAFVAQQLERARGIQKDECRTAAPALRHASPASQR